MSESDVSVPVIGTSHLRSVHCTPGFDNLLQADSMARTTGTSENNSGWTAWRVDEDNPFARSLGMSEETTYLRTQAKRCRGMAEYASSGEGKAILQFVARDFDEAADGLENMNGRRLLSTQTGLEHECLLSTQPDASSWVLST